MMYRVTDIAKVIGAGIIALVLLVPAILFLLFLGALMMLEGYDAQKMEDEKQ